MGIQFTYAQGSGTVSGKVVDNISGEELPYANVYLEGTSLGTSTNDEGEFIIHQIPVGDYQLITTYIGYKDQTITVNVIAGNTLELDIKLDYAGVGDVEMK